MKDHPLTPMRDSSLVRLMAAQSQYSVGLTAHEHVAGGRERLAAALDAMRGAGHRHVVVDALTDRDLLTIGAAATAHPLVTGGSGIAIGLAENFRDRRRHCAEAPFEPVPGMEAVLAGSCSQATRDQIDHVRGSWPHRKLDITRIAAGLSVAEETIAWAMSQTGEAPLLVYGSSDPAELSAIHREHGRDRSGALMEATIGRIAAGLAANGFRRLVVAGGETAGAVVSALGVRALRIGPEIAPGVPWTETLNGPRLALALKSGNFGAGDFFPRAFAMLP